jgi:hypothetical protein
MRLPVVLLIVSAAAFLGGGALIGIPALGACLIFESLCTATWALLRDDGAPAVTHDLPTLNQILDRVRRAA